MMRASIAGTMVIRALKLWRFTLEWEGVPAPRRQVLRALSFRGHLSSEGQWFEQTGKLQQRIRELEAECVGLHECIDEWQSIARTAEAERDALASRCDNLRRPFPSEEALFKEMSKRDPDWNAYMQPRERAVRLARNTIVELLTPPTKEPKNA